MPKVLSSLFVFVVILAACGTDEIRPVDLEVGDMCSFCRMAISERPFAAELIDNDGEAHKFDDIGCMLRYKEASGKPFQATFVTDYESRMWMRAEDAYFVRSTSIKTPMGSGLIAYATAAKAGDDSVRFDRLTVR